MNKSNTVPTESKVIIRVVIKSESGYGLLEDAYKDKVTITKDSIRYEYTPYLISNTNYVRKWSYKTTSPIFQKKYEELTKLLPEALACEDYFVKDIWAISFSVTYSDKTKEDREFYLPGDDFRELFYIVKQMIPSCEMVPEAIMTSEDYEKNDEREDSGNDDY